MAKAPRKVTIREVATAAGVSPATVSLVYNDKGEIASATRERVLQIGEQLGYQPGWISKVFRSGRTHVIGVAVQHSTTSNWEHTYLPYYRGIIAGAAMEALEHGYTITAMRIGPNDKLEGRFALDGIIVVDPIPDDPFVIDALKRGMAVVAEGGWVGDAPDGALRSVRTRIEAGVPLALDELLRRGGQRPAFFRGPDDDLYTEMSSSAYVRWCQQHEVAPLEYRLEEGERPIDGARDLLAGDSELRKSVYCLNSTYARAIIAAAAETGLDVPDDLVVAVAAEKQELAVDPRLIILTLDPIESGAQSARTLIKLLEGETPGDVCITATLLSSTSQLDP